MYFIKVQFLKLTTMEVALALDHVHSKCDNLLKRSHGRSLVMLDSMSLLVQYKFLCSQNLENFQNSYKITSQVKNV